MVCSLLHDMRLRGLLDRQTVIYAMKQVLMDDNDDDDDEAASRFSS